MSSNEQGSGRVELDPTRLLGFSQLTRVSGATGGTDALFNKRGSEVPSRPAAEHADSLFNKRGGEGPAAPLASRAIDALLNKRGTEGPIIHRGK